VQLPSTALYHRRSSHATTGGSVGTRVGRGVVDTGALVGFDVLGEAVGALVTGAGVGVGISVDAIVGFSVGSGTGAGVAFVGWGVNSRTVACSSSIRAWTPVVKRHMRFNRNVVFMVVAASIYGQDDEIRGCSSA